MKLRLLQELLELNQAFDRVLDGLARMEKDRMFQHDIIRYARAEVESARVDSNREFFEKFDQIVEDDAGWAYQFRRECDRKGKDVEDLYLEIKEREETRKKKGLPPRLTILPNWALDDEKRYDEQQAAERRRSAKGRKTPIKQKSIPAEPFGPEQSGVSAAPESRSRK